MKASEIIEELQILIEKFGDLETYVCDIVGDDEGEEYNVEYEIDSVVSEFGNYFAIIPGLERDEV